MAEARASQVPRVFLDTSVFVYAIGTEHPLKPPSVAILRGVADGRLVAETSVLVVQELVHQRTRRTGDRDAARERGRELFQMCVVHPVGSEEARRALDLFVAHSDLDIANAVHAAVALERGAEVLVSADRAFADVSGLTWLAPARAVEVLGLPTS